ncbi:hypothetical protein HMPREF9080_00987 [Cardiobacterium valvarum F0432]|uniref:Uncharacterized protein n=1 Tax=Cardiobacterium valvarum F0432 TaxID=797473 RepID=G9ZE03_9GAMM|nr:hypothetical protein HMPREF9080_00987 [Cardiobacterium valvarum F0432]
MSMTIRRLRCHCRQTATDSRKNHRVLVRLKFNIMFSKNIPMQIKYILI